ncbi:hypothetical protein [Sphingobium sp. CAP-1]|uniref:hypothetical protein n=1 Tax=Sphingobium sp. CAP-1 TaxID=2676077 RepID=UPI0012BB1E8C|nr:hypothetical protein [Sphingobium sp. CAP-1]QGP81266.1 hypothetical protein GL174_19740 [Sphingobium sp. CAP-1]
MNFDDQLQRYFGTRDVDALPAAALATGIERMRVDFGLEVDPARRFALWSLLYLLGQAPDLDAFENPADREAARNFMDMNGRCAARHG